MKVNKLTALLLLFVGLGFFVSCSGPVEHLPIQLIGTYYNVDDPTERIEILDSDGLFAEYDFDGSETKGKFILGKYISGKDEFPDNKEFHNEWHVVLNGIDDIQSTNTSNFFLSKVSFEPEGKTIVGFKRHEKIGDKPKYSIFFTVGDRQVVYLKK